MCELKDIRRYAKPVIIGSAAIYVSVGWIETISIKEAQHIPAGALANLATGSIGSSVPVAYATAITNTAIGGDPVTFVPNTIAEGLFAIPTAPERQMLGDNQVTLPSNYDATAFATMSGTIWPDTASIKIDPGVLQVAPWLQHA
jgi:hypothetical protein